MYQTHYSNYLIQGKDTSTFLQGQFSCDMQKVNQQEHISHAGAYCLPDGKVLAYFYLSKLADDTYLLTTNDKQAETFLKRLRLFVLRADVKFEWVDYVVWGMRGKPGESLDDNSDREWIDIVLNQSLYLRVYPNAITPVQDNPHSIEEWHYLETLAGIPKMNDTLRGQFILPFINLDWLGAVSYQKGCYVGQEMIARLYHRSVPAKRSFVYSTEEDLSALPLSETIVCVDDDNKRCRITPIRVAFWQGKTALLLEMAIRHAPRDRLILTHQDKNYELLCEPQPYNN